jgi:hypothetical protein
MQTLRIAALCCLLALMFVRHAFADILPWTKIQALGGISIGKPVEKDGLWMLPVQADVSGLSTITKFPTQMNSGAVCARILVEVHDSTVLLAVQTSLPGAVARSAVCPPALLGPELRGVYSVVYKGPDDRPHMLGTIHVGI